MKVNARPFVLMISICAGIIFLCAAERMRAQSEPAKSKSDAPQITEQKFKNIQVLEGNS